MLQNICFTLLQQQILHLKGATIISDAIKYVISFKEDGKEEINFVKFEVKIRFNNGNVIDGVFNDKESARKFLEQYEPTII